MLNPAKLALIDRAIQEAHITSFADLGGVWLVDGGYSTYALDQGVARGVLVDIHPELLSDQTRSRAHLEIIKGNFASHETARNVDVDAVFLFDVLLHQVMPDWDYVLGLYAKRARCFLIFNQQWIATRRSVRLMDLGKQEFFRNAPNSRDTPFCRELFEKLYEPYESASNDWDARVYRDVSTVWQWGITDDDLVAEMTFHGFELAHYENHGQAWELPNFEHHALMFTRSNG